MSVPVKFKKKGNKQGLFSRFLACPISQSVGSSLQKEKMPGKLSLPGALISGRHKFWVLFGLKALLISAMQLM